ncbi:MAG TPA: methyltransferase domain-containing protein [Sphingomicrobium sp.]|jgi:ubiquinone/menaquinone biosynthesis C-methylase UbiE|nr:methyltransferase domain-containing protein [Sphingomicrobium sp.]
MWNRIPILAALALLSCRGQPRQPLFPEAHRDVAPIVGDTFSTEDARDRLGEAQQVMQLAGVRNGMWVADVGAGQGYYTVRLARVVGASGRVLAEDILPDVTDQLSDRVQRQRLDNVAVKLGTPDDPQLPAHTFDRIFLVHMYHEVASPYAFLWHMREGLKADGLVIVVDADRPVKLHGMPPAQLRCELAALNLKPANFTMLAGGETYFMAFRAVGPRPSPQAIRPCASG